jgi:hypothetical protein
MERRSLLGTQMRDKGDSGTNGIHKSFFKRYDPTGERVNCTSSGHSEVTSENLDGERTMKPGRMTACLVIVLLGLNCFSQCAVAQFLEDAVRSELCGVGQQYIDDLASLIDRSGHGSYPALEATQMHTKYYKKYWDVYRTRCPDCDIVDGLWCSEFVENFCTAIRRWGESHFPGLLTQQDATEKTRAAMLSFCRELSIPEIRKSKQRIERKEFQ